MTRGFWIKAHLFVAAFFAPALTVIALSGGLYLLGIKGSVEKTPITAQGKTLDLSSQNLEDDVRKLLGEMNIAHEFEYLKQSGSTLYTRPTSRTHYEFAVSADAVAISRNEPSAQKRLIELHKGHGPLLFKDFQKAMAAALLFVMLSGAWLGLSSAGLRNSTLLTTGSGLLVFLGLAYLI